MIPGRDNVVEHRVGIGVEERAGESEAGEPDVDDPQRDRVAHQDDERHGGQQSEALHGHTPCGMQASELVRKASGQQHADEGEQVGVEHRVEAGAREVHAEILVEIGRHPREIARQHEDQPGEADGEDQGRRRGEDHAEALRQPGLGLHGRRGGDGGRLLLVFQPHGHDDAVHDADGAEDVKGAAPAPQLPDIARSVAADDDADVVGGLVDRHGEGPGLVVVLRQQRIVGRSEECLAAARGDAAHQHEHHEPVAEAREHRGHAPEQDTPRDDPFPAETVAHQSPNRDQHGVEKVEDRGDGADGHCQTAERGGPAGEGHHIAQAQVLADERKHHVEDLTVGLVQEIGDPQQGQHLPFVLRVFLPDGCGCHWL